MHPPTPTPPAAHLHRRARAKAPDTCPCCGREARRLHKVRVHYGKPWVAACVLAAVLIERSDATVYGGMIAARSMRRKRAG